jgi:hypothetical protein
MAKGFGRVQKRRQKLEKCKDRLSELNEIIPWEVFRRVRIEKAVGKIKPPKRAKVEQENSIVR